MAATRCEIPERERPVTLIAAMVGKDELLIAADSGAMEGTVGAPPMRFTVPEKIRRHRTRPIAWGMTGDPTVGDEDFGVWLADLKHDGDHASLVDLMERRLAAANGRVRAVMREAGQTEEQLTRAGATVLLAGYDPDPFILELNDSGTRANYLQHGFMAVGTGKVHAWVAYQTLARVNIPDARTKLQIIMDTASRMAPGCDPPVNIFSITPAGITHIAGVLP